MTLDRNQWIGIGLLSGLALLWKRDKIGAESFDAEDEHDCEYKRGLFSILESDYGGDRNDTINSVAEDFGFTSCFECARNHSTFRRDCKHLCPECREISEGCWCDYCEQCEEKPLDCNCDNKDAESVEAGGVEFYVVVKKEGQVMANVIHRTFNLEEAIDYAERLWSDGIYEEVEVDCPDAETVVWMNGEWEDAWLELNAESFEAEDGYVIVDRGNYKVRVHKKNLDRFNRSTMHKIHSDKNKEGLMYDEETMRWIPLEAESFEAEESWWMSMRNSCGNNDCDDGHCPNCGCCKNWAMDEDEDGRRTGMNYCGSCSHRFNAESFEADFTVAMDTTSQAGFRIGEPDIEEWKMTDDELKEYALKEVRAGHGPDYWIEGDGDEDSIRITEMTREHPYDPDFEAETFDLDKGYLYFKTYDEAHRIRAEFLKANKPVKMRKLKTGPYAGMYRISGISRWQQAESFEAESFAEEFHDLDSDHKKYGESSPQRKEGFTPIGVYYVEGVGYCTGVAFAEEQTASFTGKPPVFYEWEYICDTCTYNEDECQCV